MTKTSEGRTAEERDREFARDEFLTLVYIYIYIWLPSDVDGSFFLLNRNKKGGIE